MIIRLEEGVGEGVETAEQVEEEGDGKKVVPVGPVSSGGTGARVLVERSLK